MEELDKKETLFDRVLKNLHEKRNRILSGKINCIPIGFERFSKELPGVEQAKSYLITASSKVNILK